ncbi:amino acid adenylation domain-containing protein [Methylotuvimicrobium sp. KM2]|uniref:amino acid adenylation domain-containing protein n=1 Tax=Methylotuvimicrobium sp. KM2 TaxID=3133976 RepID=UPI003100C800
MRFIDESGLTTIIQTPISNLVELACRRANDQPGRTAYVFLQDGENESGRLTFAQLDRRARAVAAKLQSMGMTGERALLLYPPGLDYIVGFFGCLYAGVIAVPASPPARRQRSRLLAVFNDAAPAIIMTTTDLAVKFRNEFACGSDAFVATKAASRDEGVAPAIPEPAWFTTDNLEGESVGDWVKPALNANSLAFLQYTSGSTGDPKGVMVSHGNLIANQEAIKQGFGHTERTTVVGWLPLYHDMGLIGNLLQPLYLGSTAILMPPMAFLEKPVRWLKAISNYRANTSGGPNFAYDLCLRKVTEEQMQGLDLSTWTLAFNGSEPVRATTMERFAEKFADKGFRRESFFPCYGLAEATLFVSGAHLPPEGEAQHDEDKSGSRPVSCGATTGHHEIRIVDPETGRLCREGHVGEIWLAGPSIAQGYCNRPEESEHTFRARLSDTADSRTHTETNGEQAFLRTGDLGFLDNGHLYITGRIKDLIIIRGRNVYPQDIEQTLTEEIPALVPGGCVAFSINHEDEEQLIVVAEMTRAAMRSGDYESIIAAMRKVLAEVCELAAAEWVLVQPGTVLKTSSGKVRRQPCKQRYLENSLPVLFRSGEQSPVECSLIGEQARPKAWEENSPEYQLLQQALLAVPRAQRAPLIASFLKQKIALLLKIEASALSAGSSLRALGLDSLKAVELKHETDELLGIDAPLSLFLSDDSLENIAEKLSETAVATLEQVVHAHSSDGLEHSALYDSNLSATQFSMWTMQQLEPNSIIYNLHLALRIAGAIDRERLRQAFRYLAERHAVLRTIYRAGGNDRVIQQVLPVSELPDFFTTVDASAWPESQLQDDMARRAREPFDLATGPLFRIACYAHEKPGLQNDPGTDSHSLSADKFVWSEFEQPTAVPKGEIHGCNSYTAHTLLICAHHIAVDLWSVLILINELKTIYAELSTGMEPQSAVSQTLFGKPDSQALLADSGSRASKTACPSKAWAGVNYGSHAERGNDEVKADYTDFVAWQRHYLNSPACDKAWTYWQRQLTGELPLLSVPTDHPRPAVSDHRGASVAFRLDRDETERLKKLAGQQGVTLFALLLTAYKVLLHRYTHQKDLIVGVPTSGRSQSRFTPVVGNFVNPLPLRSSPSGNKAFSAYLAEVNEALLNALEYQDFPFSLLVDRLQPERVADHWPIYQTLFVLQQAQAGFDTDMAQLALGEDGSPSLWDERTMQSLTLCQRIERFDLKLMAAECGDGLLLSLQYRCDLFTAETVDRIAAHFHNLLDGVMANPEARIASLPMIRDKERKKLLYDWNASDQPFSEDSCMHQLFEAQAERTPNADAVVCNGERLTYGELNVAAQVWEHHLIRLGVGPGARVGICVERSMNFIIGILAILKAGAAYVPIDSDFPAERVAHMLGDAGADVLLSQSGLYKTAKLPVSVRLNLDEAQEPAIEPIVNKRSRNMPDHGAYVIYTSGSTGQSKGVAVSHRSLVNYTQAIAGQIQAEAGLQYALISTPAADLGNTVLFASLVSGGCLHILDHDTTTDGRLLAGYINRNPIDVLKIVPSHFAALLDSAEGKNIVPRRTLIFGGDVLQNSLVTHVASIHPKCRIFNHYGPTEATIGALIYPVVMKAHGNTSDAQVPIGRPIANSQTYILDENLEPVPVGVPGELYIGGQGVAQGYLNRPDLTAERFIPDPFAGMELGEDSSILKPKSMHGVRLYRTGDLARYRSDGLVEFLGRADHQMKIRGFRIEPGEIEAHLCAQSEVSSAIVSTWEDSPGIKRLVAYIVPVSVEPDQEALRAHVRNALPDYMVPSAFVFLTKWPLTANGKLDRKALPKPDPGSSVSHQYVAPRNDAEVALAAIWADVLRVARVGIHDNFFSLGGDSILSIQMASRARQAGLNLSPRQIFQHQTVAELAPVVESEAKFEAEQCVVSGSTHLTPVQQKFLSRALTNPHHWNQALLLQVLYPFESEIMQCAVEQLLVHHDVLRLRFNCQDGVWQAHYVAEEQQPVFHLEDLSGITDNSLETVLIERTAYWQRQIDMSNGPMIQVIWFALGQKRGTRLLMVIHHLAMDIASWRILLDDLVFIYNQIATNSKSALPSKTTSYRQWAERLTDYAQTLADTDKLPMGMPEHAQTTLPVDYPEGSNTEADAVFYTLELSEPQTRSLVQESGAAYRTSVQELLLIAVVKGLASHVGLQHLPIEVEVHNRDSELFRDFDFTRTAGRFTTSYPVFFHYDSTKESSSLIKDLKEQFRQQAAHGFDYTVWRWLGGGLEQELSSEIPILFNYLGHLDLGTDAHAYFRQCDMPAWITRDPLNQRAHELALNAAIRQGRLQLTWVYSKARYCAASIEQLGSAVLNTLSRLIEHCLDSDSAGLTPSDFPLAKLTQVHLDSLPYSLRNIEDIYPLGPMQEGMLFYALMYPGSGIYHMLDRYEVDGAVDVDAFRAAWQDVLDRHPILRTSFLWEEYSRPHQFVHKQVALPFNYQDWREVPLHAQERRFDELLRAEVKTGFDFTTGHLMRIHLVRFADKRYRFIRSHHHILMDAWCKSPVLLEFRANYEALVKGEAMPFREAVSPYRDYIAWLESQDRKVAENFWRDYLKGFVEPTPLIVDKPTSGEAEATSQVRDLVVLLSEADTQGLNTLSQRYQLTPNSFLQGAWALMLAHYSGNNEVLFGVTVAGRPTDLPGVETALGLFINTLPLRVVVQPEQTVLAFLRNLLYHNLELRQYEYMPLVRIQALSDLAKGQALFQHLFVFENAPVDPTLRGETDVLNIVDDKHRTHANYPINAVLVPGSRFHLQVTYDVARFEEDVVKRLLEHFKILLEGIIRHPEARLGELPMLTERESKLIFTQWNQTQHLYSEPRDMVALFEKQAALAPDAIAVAFQGQELTYFELNNRANRVAHALMSEGADPESLIALFSERGIDYLVMMLGAFKAGMAYLPLDPSHPDGRIAQVLKESGAAWVLTCASNFDRASDLADRAGETAGAVQQAPGSLGLQLLSRPDVFVLEELEADENSTENPPKRHGPDNLAFVIFTSGSTGKPKGAMVEYKGMFNNLITKVPALDLTERDVIAQTAGQCFDISVWQHLTALVCGARVEIIPDEIVKEPYRLLVRLGESGVTVLEAVPSMIQALLDCVDTLGLPKLRWLIACGEAFPPELCRRWMERMPHVKVLNAYGPAECSDDVSYYEVPVIPSDAEIIVPVGRPVHNTRLYLLNRWLEPVPIGVPGEICVAGIQVGRGYLDRPDLTAEKFIPDPFDETGCRMYRTGDLGRHREDGAIEFLGRIDHQVKIRGFRIEPGEIEAQLLTYPKVEQALVVVREDDKGGKRLVAYVVCGEQDINTDTGLFAKLREHLFARLPDAMMPQAFVRLDAMPLGANGKIDRKALPEPDMTGQSDRAYIEPRNPAEEALADIWKEVLGIERVGVADNFFELGGHSLLAVQVLSRIRRAFGVEVPLRRLFNASTIEALALLVEELLIEHLDTLSEEEAEALLIEDEEGISMDLKQPSD